MVTFDSSDTGTLESEWAHADRWQRLPRFARPIEHLVVLAAHPDDETLGAGGLIESVARDGARITIVVATDGEGSHPASPTHTPWQLSRIRRREMRKAIDHLAADAVIHHCEIPDGQLLDHVDEVADCVVELIDRCRAAGHDRVAVERGRPQGPPRRSGRGAERCRDAREASCSSTPSGCGTGGVLTTTACRGATWWPSTSIPRPAWPRARH